MRNKRPCRSLKLVLLPPCYSENLTMGSFYKLEWRPKGIRLGAALLGWVLLLHFAGIYLFTRGFLLTRMALSDITTCSGEDCTLPATHDKLVLLIIDSLRFDFISDSPPSPNSPYHHNILTLPRQITKKYPDRSFIFNAHADPPTTTLQRIKGITTGSLPTFIDLGSNFGKVERGPDVDAVDLLAVLTDLVLDPLQLRRDVSLDLLGDRFEPILIHSAGQLSPRHLRDSLRDAGLHPAAGEREERGRRCGCGRGGRAGEGQASVHGPDGQGEPVLPVRVLEKPL